MWNKFNVKEKLQQQIPWDNLASVHSNSVSKHLQISKEVMNHDGFQSASVTFFMTHPTHFGIIENKNK